MKLLMKIWTRICRWGWSKFLRVGHDLVWKADEWFQCEEIKLREGIAHIECAPKKDESANGKHVENDHSERDEFPRLGRNQREGSPLRGASESIGSRRSRRVAGVYSGSDGHAVESEGHHAGSARTPRRRTSDESNSRALTGRKSAADFDRRIVARRTAFAGMVLARAQE
jgi:hypothetical protein